MKKEHNNRRQFLLKGSLLSAGLLSAPALIQAALSAELRSELAHKHPGEVILFQGDSITDGNRNRGRYYPNDGAGMGFGYVYQIASHLLGRYPDKQFKCYNRGISGHKVFQLADRWEDDCIQLAPDVLSLLIGVNDFWHTKTHSFKGTAESYEADLRQLLDRTRQSLPNVKIIIGEPFFVEDGSALDKSWFPEFDRYRAACARVAKDLADAFIPYNLLFATALKTAPVSYWCPDGVHPSMAGGHLMANAWLEAYQKL